jgi:hypothetical protein
LDSEKDKNPSGGELSGRAEISDLQQSLAEQGSAEKQERLPVEAPAWAFERQEKLIVGESKMFASAHIEESETPFQQEGTIDIVPDDSNSDLNFKSLSSKN